VNHNNVPTAAMPQKPTSLRLPSGRSIPVLGQGTWGMGEKAERRRAEVAALRLGLDLGISLIDTAEMYGEGGAEEVAGEAINGRREHVFLVSKVYPHNATRRGVMEACARSLRRLKTDYLDLYLLHWRGRVPLEETLMVFQALQQAGTIRDYGVSNFDVDDMEQARALPGGEGIVVNQVLYSLVHRGIEWDLLPWCRSRGIPIMAYSPIENSGSRQRKLLGDHAVKSVAARRGASPAQVALAWVLQKDVVVIPKAVEPGHIRENRAALDLRLTQEDLAALDAAFPPPHGKVPLAML
jgi:diketogulonate reductase-like aldo/keto reductase